MSAFGSGARTCACGLSIAGWAMAAFSLVLCTPPFEGLADSVFLIGSVAIAPAGCAIAGLLACAAVALRVAGVVARGCARARLRAHTDARTLVPADARARADACAAAHRGVDSEAAGGKGRRAVRWVASGLMACALAAVLAASGFRCLLDVPYVADPASPAGDRVVVVERNVLLSGNGTVYLVPNGFGFGIEVARYGADDGYSPMGNGTYSLEWDGRVPVFEALGTPADPVGMYPPE